MTRNTADHQTIRRIASHRVVSHRICRPSSAFRGSGGEKTFFAPAACSEARGVFSRFAAFPRFSTPEVCGSDHPDSASLAVAATLRRGTSHRNFFTDGGGR